MDEEKPKTAEVNEKSKGLGPGEVIGRMTGIAMLSALGWVLMSFAQFPYPGAPWLKVEVSEVMTLIAYAMYGWGGALLVAAIKTALDIAVHGLVDLGIGYITAFLNSCLYIFGLWLCSHVFKLFQKKIGWRVLGYGIIITFASLVMTMLNAIFITPSFLTTVYAEDNPHFSTCFDPGVIESIIKRFTKQENPTVNGWVYVGAVSMKYVPFNLMKGAMVCAIYEILFNRVIFILAPRSEFLRKYFLGSLSDRKKKKVEEEEKEDEDDAEQELISGDKD